MAMKIGLIILSLLRRLAIKYGHQKLSDEGGAIQVPVKRGKSLQRRGIEDVEKKNDTIRNGAQSQVPNMSDFYMIMPGPIRLPLLYFFAKREGNSFTTSSLFTRPCPL